MSQFKRGKTWVAKFVSGGEQHWVPGGPWASKRAAREAEAAYRVELASRSAGAHDWTCAEWADHWLNEIVASLEDSTRAGYTRAATLYKEEFGDTPIDSLDRPRARTWARKQTQSVRDATRSMHNYALNDGVVRSNGNVFSAMGIKGKEKSRKVKAERLPSMAEYDRFISLCEPMIVNDAGELVPGPLGEYGPEMKRMLMVAAWVGPRQGELFVFEKADLDFDRGLIHIYRARKASGTIGATKGKADEWVVVPPFVLEELRDCDLRPYDQFLFHSAEGKPLLKNTFYHQWDKLRHAAGAPTRRWHDWRHFCATQLLEMGMDDFAVSVQLTHQDGGTLVRERYGHPSHDRAKDRLRMAYGGVEIGSTSGSNPEQTKAAG